ncbi:MAG: hypothetical protein IPH65_05090 [Dehalococcoidia bacterium]|uniref:hypothetical protein n=1 Tax=Candidatus Amarobacter glycogenicus TaxID=3140699 RepID=UPI0031356ED9|nr:hypothetical protein [Dehalococcoidia bacterium]
MEGFGAGNHRRVDHDVIEASRIGDGLKIVGVALDAVLDMAFGVPEPAAVVIDHAAVKA